MKPNRKSSAENGRSFFVCRGDSSAQYASLLRRTGYRDGGFSNALCVSAMPSDVAFSNRPFGVKHFQAIHHCSVDVAHGLALLFGIGTRALVWRFFSQEV